MEITGLPNNTTGNLKQKKIISWAPVDQATEERAPVIGLITKHVDCCMKFKYNQCVCDVLLFFETDQKNQAYP